MGLEWVDGKLQLRRNNMMRDSDREAVLDLYMDTLRYCIKCIRLASVINTKENAQNAIKAINNLEGQHKNVLSVLPSNTEVDGIE